MRRLILYHLSGCEGRIMERGIDVEADSESFVWM